LKRKLFKKINISPKRQITIPKEIYDQMEIRNNRVQVYLEGKRMVIESVSEQEDIFDFTGQIKEKLEKEGYTGHELAVKLAQQKQLVEKAFAQIITEAEEEYRTGKTVSHEELFADIAGED